MAVIHTTLATTAFVPKEGSERSYVVSTKFFRVQQWPFFMQMREMNVGKIESRRKNWTWSIWRRELLCSQSYPYLQLIISPTHSSTAYQRAMSIIHLFSNLQCLMRRSALLGWVSWIVLVLIRYTSNQYPPPPEPKVITYSTQGR